MTTPIPTSEAGGILASPVPIVSAFPDAELIAQLANQLFSAPPGSVPASEAVPSAPTRPVSFAAPPVPSVPTLANLNLLPQPTALASPVGSPPLTLSLPAAASLATPPSQITPRLLPTAAQSVDPPAFASTVTPALGRAAGPTAGVPEASAAALPPSPPLPTTLDAARPAASPSPFYFIADPASTPASPPAPSLPLALDGLPVLTPALPPTRPEPPASRAPVSVPSFYFAEPASKPAGDGIPAVPPGRGAFDVHAVRRDFPILRERVNGRPLVWFDNAATTQKPQSVIDRLSYFYEHENSNIHRAAHELAARATDAYESARQKVARFIGAGSVEEIIFVRGATEAINLVARTWGQQNVEAGDEIIVSHLEHHANIVPWQMLASEKGARLRVIPVDDTGQVRLDEFQKLLNARTRIVAVTQVSNALGTIVPVDRIIEMAHRAGARVLVDGAQSVSHLRVNVRALDADFLVFSGHKIFGPTGIGVVYGKRELLEQMPPYQGGGNMIQDVTFEQTVFHGPPARFEAGTGNIADAVGLGAALDYVERIGLETIARYEHELLEHGLHGLRTVPGLHLIGCAKERTSVMSFVLDGYSTEQVGKALNEEGIAVRSGHHCAQPILRRFGQETTVRPSVAFYNTFDEIDLMVATLRRLAGQRR